jgi:RecB family exonuclease
MSVTEIKTLIRDPYAIYARHILRLRPLGDLVQAPDALIRGTIVHEIMEQFARDVSSDPSNLSCTHLLDVARSVLDEHAPWPTARALWLSRVERISDWFIARESDRRDTAVPIAIEDSAKGLLTFADIGFSLTARADRIDRAETGAYRIYDYKTGVPPTKAQQRQFDKQLLIMAAMIETGQFEGLTPDTVQDAVFIGLGSTPKEVSAPLDEEPTSDVLAGLHMLVTSYLAEHQGYTSRRMMEKDRFGGDYDQLARFGEWDATDDPVPEVLK